MTASEKLRALDYELGGEAQDIGVPLTEIIAVVAAAERVASYDDIHTWKRDGETTALPELANPLAALDAALHAN